MPENLLPCIIAHFNEGVLHVLNMRRMVLYNNRWRLQWAVVESLDSELKTLAMEGSGVIKPLEWQIWFQIWVSSKGDDPKKVRRGGGSGMDSGTLRISREKLLVA